MLQFRIAILISLCAVTAPAKGEECHLLTFEGGGTAPIDPAPVPGTEPIGVQFTAESQWFTLTSPPGDFDPTQAPSGGTVAIWLTPSGCGEVTFDAAVSRINLFFASDVDVTLEVFDASGSLVGASTGTANNSAFPLSNWSPLTVTLAANVITSMRLTTTGNTIIDDLDVCLQTAEDPTDVEIDLHPENADNAVDPFNLNSNKPVEVAVFSTADFDATQLDVTTVTLGDPTLIPFLWALSASVVDVDGDGLNDVIFDFGPARDFGDAGALDENSSEVSLTGAIFAGGQIEGHDTVLIVGNGP